MRRWQSLVAAALAALIVAVFAGAQTGTSPGDALDAALGALQAQIDENDAELADHEARIAALEAAEPPPPPPPPAQCANELDDDGDGLIDLADPGCADAADDNESDDPPPPPPGDTEAPSEPGNLRQTGATETTISIAWDASADNVGVAGYYRYRNDVRAANETTTLGHTFSGGGLACGQSVPVGVEAFDAAGNVSSRATITASTSACPEPEPEGEVVEAADNLTCSDFLGPTATRTIIRSGARIAVLRITQPLGVGAIDAANFRDCSDVVIDRIEALVRGADGLKFNAGSSDIEIGSGYVRFRGAAAGAHQDGIQPVNGGGLNAIVRNVVFSGMDTQGVITSGDGNLLCVGCAFLPEHDGLVPTHPQVNGGPANAAFFTVGTHGSLDSLFCVGTRFNNGVSASANAVGWLGDDTPEPGSGNEVVYGHADPRCLAAG